MPGLSTRIYECEVRGVNENDRTVNALSANGTHFKNVTYVLPWISLRGSGLDCVPQNGDKCLILASGEHMQGRRGAPKANQSFKGRMAYVMGFVLPPTPNAAGLYLGDRIPDLPQGSIALRTISEDGNDARVLITRGGTVVLQSNEACKTVYSPIDNSITHIFDNWEMKGPGGFVRWTREDGESEVKYEAQYRVGASEEEGQQVNVRIGGDADTPIEISVGEPTYERPYLRVTVNAQGEANIEGEIINITGRVAVNIDGADMRIKGRQVLDQQDPI